MQRNSAYLELLNDAGVPEGATTFVPNQHKNATSQRRKIKPKIMLPAEQGVINFWYGDT